ncbi:alpha/beta hydrolase [Actinomadura syzygii]|uniref:Alpha/beta hydrolase n=1 Tax=Actinomadura syzygii TaxID=1427538 RepID=A0A5D0TY96_9ACTN|nr:alpha/beta hydrolase [Actinomadura syzygii]TYC10315.1 alpha/beta hydrolase [Actinomadura syzygii]
MNDVEELKQFVVVHARAQSIPKKRYTEVLARIDNDVDGRPGSWAVEWTRVADALRARGQLLDACRYYGLARFPFVDGPARRAALESCVGAFDQWRSGTGLEPLEVELKGGVVRCWTSGLSATRRLPLLVMTGGIVSVKEQWAPMLARLGRLGMAGIVTEMPGVGENTLPYDEDSPAMLSGILDAVADRADVDHTYAACMSFSGHLALRAAADDPRIRGIVTAGVPVSAFFTDERWRRRVPRVTVDTLAHLLGTGSGEVFDRIGGWALDDALLGSLGVPVHCAASTRDEIIPAADVELLRRAVRDLSLVENDDVHGSPRHATETRLWVVLSLLRMRRTGGPAYAVLRTLHAALRLRGRFTRAAPAAP